MGAAASLIWHKCWNMLSISISRSVFLHRGVSTFSKQASEKAITINKNKSKCRHFILPRAFLTALTFLCFWHCSQILIWSPRISSLYLLQIGSLLWIIVNIEEKVFPNGLDHPVGIIGMCPWVHAQLGANLRGIRHYHYKTLKCSGCFIWLLKKKRTKPNYEKRHILWINVIKLIQRMIAFK